MVDDDHVMVRIVTGDLDHIALSIGGGLAEALVCHRAEALHLCRQCLLAYSQGLLQMLKIIVAGGLRDLCNADITPLQVSDIGFRGFERA